MRIVLFFISFLVSSQILAEDNNIQVVTSIRPIQLITNEIMLGAGHAEVIIQSTQSPHHFQLKPSQLKIASHTDLLIYISDDFETGLKRLKTALPTRGVSLELISYFSDNHLIRGDHEIDGHVWLSPENVTLMVQLITDKLLEVDPLNQQIYLDNSIKLIDKITQWKRKSQKILRDKNPKYILEHQFLAYFEKSFGLQNIGSFRNNHDQGSSIKQLKELHSRLKKNPANCLLIPGMPISNPAKQISEQYNLQIKLVDLLGRNREINNIIDLLDAIVKPLSSCHK